MRRRKLIIFRCPQEIDDGHSSNKDEKELVHAKGEVITPSGKSYGVDFSFPYAQSANALMSAKGYIEYVKKNGYHFNEKLAEHVSRMLYKNSPLQYVPDSQITDLMNNTKMTFGDKVTKGDIMYAFNYAYVHLYPELLKDMKACLFHVYKEVNSSHGYDGMIFCRWTADVIGRGIKIDWEKFV